MINFNIYIYIDCARFESGVVTVRDEDSYVVWERR